MWSQWTVAGVDSEYSGQELLGSGWAAFQKHPPEGQDEQHLVTCPNPHWLGTWIPIPHIAAIEKKLEQKYKGPGGCLRWDVASARWDWACSELFISSVNGGSGGFSHQRHLLQEASPPLPFPIWRHNQPSKYQGKSWWFEKSQIWITRLLVPRFEYFNSFCFTSKLLRNYEVFAAALWSC